MFFIKRFITIMILQHFTFHKFLFTNKFITKLMKISFHRRLNIEKDFNISL